MWSTIKKWGNSLALRIPKAYAQELGVEENSRVSIEIKNDRLIIKRGQTLEEMLALVSDENKHEVIDFGEPIGKEMI